LQKLYEELAPRGLRVVALETVGDVEKSKEVISENKLTFQCLETRKNSLITSQWITEYPGTLIIDESGKIVFFQGGFREGDEADFRRIILELLERPAPH
jgi:peroxiredoxin